MAGDIEKQDGIVQAEGTADGQSNKRLSQPAHALTVDQFLAEIQANIQDGLTQKEAQFRLDTYGLNQWEEDGGPKKIKIIISQFTSPMALIFMLCLVVCLAIQAWMESGFIAFVIVINAVIGGWQEWSAAKDMHALKQLTTPTGTVIRDGRSFTISSKELVIGDLVSLKMGDKVPADVRLIETMNFEVDESSLTGESIAVTKHGDRVYDNEAARRNPGDRLNMAFSACEITKGRAKGIVSATGMCTALGQIALMSKPPSRRRRPKDKKNGEPPGLWQKTAALFGTVIDVIGEFLGVSGSRYTPLQKNLAKIAFGLLGIALVFFVVVLAANHFLVKKQVLIYGVGTGLSMMPASLPVVLVITMAGGTMAMKKRNVIVRAAKSLEALGAVTNICSDKTGTLTQNNMLACRAWLPGYGTYCVVDSPEPRNPTVGNLGLIKRAPREWTEDDENAIKNGFTEDMKVNSQYEVKIPQVAGYLRVAALANISVLHPSDAAQNKWHAQGDATEIAIHVFATRFNQNRSGLSKSEKSEWKEVAEFPFDSSVKKMTTLYNRSDGEQWAFTKGATERLLPLCTKICIGGNIVPLPLDSPLRDEIQENLDKLASDGLRVLSLASRTGFQRYNPEERLSIPQTDDEKVAKEDRMEANPDFCECHEVSETDACPWRRSLYEQDLVFRGLIALYDPPRTESKSAISTCRRAGITVHMLTGDHPSTARAIAIEIGILPRRMADIGLEEQSNMVMTGIQFDSLSDKEIDELPRLPFVIARCAPSTKVKMIEALHRRNKFAAMTGDGVNDSPALRQADVGIAMGSGSDVAKESADIILADDNFQSILNAVEEGRRIFDNIQKFVLHVLAENIAQAITLLIGLAFRDPDGTAVFPLSPVEILFIILITSGLPDMGLGRERAAAGIMSRPPHDSHKGIFTRELWWDMIVYGVVAAILSLMSFVYTLNVIGDMKIGRGCNDRWSEECEPVFRARTSAFSTLTWCALLLAWQLINMRRSFFRLRSKPTNPWIQPFLDVWANGMLFVAVIAGFVLVFVVIYTPVLSRKVFKHSPIDKEWGVTAIATFVFFVSIELWKFSKRVYFRKQAHKTSSSVTQDIESQSLVSSLSPRSESIIASNTKEKDMNI